MRPDPLRSLRCQATLDRRMVALSGLVSATGWLPLKRQVRNAEAVGIVSPSVRAAMEMPVHAIGPAPGDSAGQNHAVP